MRFASPLILLLLLTIPVTGQQFGFPVRLDLITPGAEFFGGDSALIDDFDGDGQGDLVIGAPGLDGNAGRVFVVRGGFAVAMAELVGAAGSRFGRATLAPGDLNGDGIRDFVVGAPLDGLDATGMTAPGRLSAYSGADLSPLWSVAGSPMSDERIGWDLRALPDLDGDGVPEIGVVGSPEIFGVVNGASERRAFQIRSGGDGAPLANLPTSTLTGSPVGLDPDDWAGLLIVDADGDGTPEALVARHLRGPSATQTHFERWSLADPPVLLGSYVVGDGSYARRPRLITDRDGDGIPELLISLAPVNGSSGTAVVVNAIDGIILETYAGGAVRDAFALRDLDGDGRGEIAVAFADDNFATNGDRVSAFSASGSILFEERGAAGGYLRRVLDVPDRNADGVRELLFLSRPPRDAFLAGAGPLNTHFRVRSPWGAMGYGGGGLSFDWTTAALDAVAGTLSLSGGAANAPFVLAVSTRATNEPLLTTGLTLHVSAAASDLILVDDSLALDARGDWQVALSLRAPGLAGVDLFLQCLQTAPSLTISNGVQIHFAP